MTNPMLEDASELAVALRQVVDGTHGEYRLLHKLPEVRDYGQFIAPEHRRIAAFLDTETTGTDPLKASVIQLGMVVFEYDKQTGFIGRVVGTLDMLRDPGERIPPEVTELTGITDVMVKGQRIEDEVISDFLQGVDLVIAHNAEYDRKIVERHWPGRFEKLHWACTQFDIPWKKHGIRTMMLEYLVMQVARTFYEAHRALDDCRAGLHLLAVGTLNNATAMAYLLDGARGARYRMWAVGAPFEVKELLKTRGYRAHYLPNGRFGCWYKEVSLEQHDAELVWLKDVARCWNPAVVELTARDRYSLRADTIDSSRSFSPYL